jgi:DNA-directed RNA polymerase subunit E'/Rpb7
MNKDEKKEPKYYGVYIKSVLEKKVSVPITQVGRNIKDVLEKKIIESISGKCISEGFVRPEHINIINYSAGIVQNEDIDFVVIFECMIAHPVENQTLECVTQTITKAGIHARVMEGDTVPVHVFIAKEHHTKDDYFNSIKENMKIKAKVIGIRYELNDPYICAICKLKNGDN